MEAGRQPDVAEGRRDGLGGFVGRRRPDLADADLDAERLDEVHRASVVRR